MSVHELTEPPHFAFFNFFQYEYLDQDPLKKIKALFP